MTLSYADNRTLRAHRPCWIHEELKVWRIVKKKKELSWAAVKDSPAHPRRGPSSALLDWCRGSSGPSCVCCWRLCRECYSAPFPAPPLPCPQTLGWHWPNWWLKIETAMNKWGDRAHTGLFYRCRDNIRLDKFIITGISLRFISQWTGCPTPPPSGRPFNYNLKDWPRIQKKCLNLPLKVKQKSL